MWKTWLFGLAALVACGAGTRPAEAHPHIWIDVVATFVFDNARVTGVRFQWTFDEFFSAGVISEFDKNKNKAFDGAEIEAVRTGAFEGVKEAGYFTDVLIGEKKVEITETKDFGAAVEKGAAVYHFTVPLAEPLDPAKTALEVTVYDKAYFVDIAFQGGKDALKLMGGGSEACKIELFDDRSNPLFGGVVFPKKARLQCAQPR
jgi:ABC-type uncharacterized transport system substrate-binding protein